MRFHGGTKSNIKPALDGLYYTLKKECSVSTLGDYILTNQKVVNYILKKCGKSLLPKFEESKDNTLRSIATFYTSGVMGKRKYLAVKVATSMKASKKMKRGRRAKTAITFMPNCPVPKLLTYNNLISEIKKIDIGHVYSVQETFSSFCNENTNGCYRDMREYLPRLASFYLNTKQDALKWFGQTEGIFLVAFGGDGCPFGKNESACSFLVSFLNVGKRVASSSDNFLVFGANVEETSAVVGKYVQHVCKQIIDLQGKVIEINGLHVTFCFEELPNDMKMLAMLSGELPNCATYFSSFANVSTNDYKNLKGKFGCSPSSTWKTWKYEKRIEIAKEVEKFKVSLDGNEPALAAVPRRKRITDFIKLKKSRQEFYPLLGKFIDKAHVEPLHLKNNAWAYFFKAVLKEAVAKSKLPPSCKSYSDVPESSCLAQIVKALKTDVKTGRLAKKVVKWFDETQARQGDLQYRFTGKESRLFCHHFSKLLLILRQAGDSKKQTQTVLALLFIGIRLRDCCSIMNRFMVNKNQLEKLCSSCLEYYRANALFLHTSVNPTIWTIGHVVPDHAKQVHAKYGQGLLTVTMEGREAKHIALHRLSNNTTYQHRWYEIFRHEFIMLIWLPEQHYEPCVYTPSKCVYIPPEVFDNNYCYCGLKKTDPAHKGCSLCNHEFMKLISSSVGQCKLVPGLS